MNIEKLTRSIVFWGFILGGIGLGIECVLNMLMTGKLYGALGAPYNGVVFGGFLGLSYGLAGRDRDRLFLGGVEGAIAGSVSFFTDPISGGVFFGILMGIIACPTLKFNLANTFCVLGGIGGALLALMLVLPVMEMYALPLEEALPAVLSHHLVFALIWGGITGASMGLFVNNTIALLTIPE